ncbi:MAG: fibrillarin-like rRNA/tRNA 2'-O-methyltransferase [Nanoarchaeota archaeon]|nr:fibrillarin-like rRNA/tRNA 2'-O-methyltransferase [Nanoarchaeota archaeon]MBU1027494.1 fibrillarin-like rRNA/tRNA 2'-O-methyltransferase [Nanoarchaeota archaeon]
MKTRSKSKTEEWNPYTSKWEAAFEKGLDLTVNKTDNILYLGASSGTTVNRVSKLTKGIIFAVENSPQMAINLVRLSKKRQNIAPIFSDARDVVFITKALFNKKINILFQDIPSRDQVEILINASKLVSKECRIFFSLKTQSISQQNPKKTLQEVMEKLKTCFKIILVKNLEPFHKKHYFLILRGS